jgi:hypothetical protein
LLRLAAALFLLTFGGASAEPNTSTSYSYQNLRNTPQIKPEQQPNSATKGNSNSNAEENSANGPTAQFPFAPSNSTDKIGDENTEQRAQEGTEFWTILGHRIKITDTLLAAFTFMLFVSTMLLWIATKSIVKSSEKSTKLLERAYIAVDGKGVLPFGQGGEDSIAVVGVRNVGRLPARDVSWFIKVGISPDGSREEFPISADEFYGRNVIPPGTEMRRSQKQVFCQTQIAGFQSASRTFMYGDRSTTPTGLGSPIY